MTILYLMIPIALLMGLGFLAVFVWNVNADQYEDMNTPAVRILNDEPYLAVEPTPPEMKRKKT